MSLYRVLLVDDEEDVRQSIVRKLDWESLGFEVAGQASNGQEALELCEKMAPDVIMTDIKMPFMGGLELCRRAKALLPGVRVAIFSGFDEFEYAREAISLEVEEYVLKPVDATELEAVFRRLRATLDKEIAESRDVERLRRHYEESLPLIRQQFLRDLLEGRLAPEVADERLAELGLKLEAGTYCVAVMRYDSEEAGARQLYAYSLQDMVEEALGGWAPCHIVRAFDQLVLLLLLPAGAGPRQIAARLDPLFHTAAKRLGLRLAVGIGGVCDTPHTVARSYAQARDALAYHALAGGRQSVYIGDVKPVAEEGEGWDAQLADEVLLQIKVGHRADLEEAFARMARRLREMPAGATQQQVFRLGVAAELLRLIRDYQVEKQAAELSARLLEQAVYAAGPDEQLHTLYESCEQLRLLLKNQRNTSAKRTVDRARQIVEQRYAENELSVDLLCRELNLSPAYFSSLFKKETGESFVAYLTGVRMERAVELLTASDDKTYQIAEQVGYADPNYFSYVFKKKYGTSPSNFRAERQEGGHG